MFFTLLARSLTRGWKRKALVVISGAFGAALVAAMLNISLDVGDKMNKELKSYGANLIVTAKTQTLPADVGENAINSLAAENLIDESALPKIKIIFWRNNIVGFAPYLETKAEFLRNQKVIAVGTWFNKSLIIPTGETAVAGIKNIKQWWKIDGKWPSDESEEALLGKNLARKLSLSPGQDISLFLGDSKKMSRVKVVGIFESADQDDNRLFLPLKLVQDGAGLPGKVSKIEVNALTTPVNELAKKAESDPNALTPQEFETWYCTAYVSSIAYQLEEIIPGVKAKPIRQVSESEGTVLNKIQMLVWLLTIAALISSALGISSLMTTSVLDRREEIGLSKSIGAESSIIVLLFLCEAAILGLLGGLLGYGTGVLLAKLVGNATFGTEIARKAFVLPLTLILSIAVVWISSISAISTIIKLSPKEVLHGR